MSNTQFLALFGLGVASLTTNAIVAYKAMKAKEELDAEIQDTKDKAESMKAAAIEALQNLKF